MGGYIAYEYYIDQQEQIDDLQQQLDDTQSQEDTSTKQNQTKTEQPSDENDESDNQDISDEESIPHNIMDLALKRMEWYVKKRNNLEFDYRKYSYLYNRNITNFDVIAFYAYGLDQ